jgi:uncharacterized peroxidase-related enzyme
MPHIELRPDLYGITSLLDYKQTTARPICDLTQLLLRGTSTLSEAERELIATYTSWLNECTFCQTAHTAATCLLPGGDETVVAAVKKDLESAPVSEKMRALLRITAKVQKSGSLMTAEDAEAARQAGATDLEIHDTVLITALFCLYNRYVDGLATVTPADPDFYQGLGQRITTRGYAVPPNGYQPFVFAKTSEKAPENA